MNSIQLTQSLFLTSKIVGTNQSTTRPSSRTNHIWEIDRSAKLALG